FVVLNSPHDQIRQGARLARHPKPTVAAFAGWSRRSPEVGITVHVAVISLRILARAASLAEAEAQIAPVERTIRERLGKLVFGVEDEELQDVVATLLATKHQSLATAESVTAGQVAERLGSVPGISAWFPGGIAACD